MRQEEIEKLARQRPFQPFEVRLVDGRTFTFTSTERFFVSKAGIHTLDTDGFGLIINLLMIATIRVMPANGENGS